MALCAFLLAACAPDATGGTVDQVARAAFDKADLGGPFPVGIVAGDDYWIFYPAAAGDPPATTVPPPSAGLARRFGKDAAATLAAATGPFSSAPPRAGPMPVILFKPGAGLGSSDYRLLLGSLAAHGYIVVGLDPFSSPDASAARYADAAREVETAASRLPAILRGAKVEADPHRLILAGHSLGGAAVVMARLPSASGAIDIDGDFAAGPPPAAARPLLYITGDERRDSERTRARRASDWAGASRDARIARRLVIGAMSHLDVTDASALPAPLVVDAVDGGRLSRAADARRKDVIRAILAAFPANPT